MRTKIAILNYGKISEFAKGGGGEFCLTQGWKTIDHDLGLLSMLKKVFRREWVEKRSALSNI